MGKTENIIVIIIFNFFLIAFIVAIITFIWQYKRKKDQHHLDMKHQHNVHQKELLLTQIEIQKQTMQEIGKEIHDNIGQQLTLASLYAHQLNQKSNPEAIFQSIQNIHAIIDNSLVDLRQLSHTLTNDSIVETTLVSLLADECKKVNAIKKCVFKSQLQEAELLLPYQYKSVLLRIAQEFIQNSIKHANCETITVALSNNPNELTLLLTDDGKGMDLQQSKSNWGIGLQNIQKRTEIIGGKMEFSSQNNGTSLTIKIPMTN